MLVVGVSGVGRCWHFWIVAFSVPERALGCGAFLWDTCCCKLQKKTNDLKYTLCCSSIINAEKKWLKCTETGCYKFVCLLHFFIIVVSLIL